MTFRSMLDRIAKLMPAFPAVSYVAEETSAREVNKMLSSGWVLLTVVTVADGAGGYPCYVLGRPRESEAAFE